MPEKPKPVDKSNVKEYSVFQKKKELYDDWEKALKDYLKFQMEGDEKQMNAVLQNLVTKMRGDEGKFAQQLSKIFALFSLFTSIHKTPDYENIAKLVALKVTSISHLRSMEKKDIAVDPKLSPYTKDILELINYLNSFKLEKTAREIDLLRQGLGLVTTKEDYLNLFKFYDEHRQHLNRALVLTGSGFAMGCAEEDIMQVKEILKSDIDYYRMEAEMQGIKL